MHAERFRKFLHERKLSDDKINSSIAIVEKYESLLGDSGDKAVEGFKAFSRMMIAEKLNTFDNYYALALYGRFRNDNRLYLAAIELIDGGGALDNLFEKTGERLGEQKRDAIFTGIELVPLGTPNEEKPAVMQAMLERLETADHEACKQILSSGLRDLPDE